MNFYEVVKDYPIIVDANPHLLSLDEQPQFELIENKSMKRVKKFGDNVNKNGAVAESKLI
jgi:hypothetical protein